MSIATEITRLQNAKSALKTSLNAKNDGSHQITNETLDNYSNFVDSIETGGGGTEPSKGIIITEWDNNGNPTKYKIKDMALVANTFNTTGPLASKMTDINIAQGNTSITSIPDYFCNNCASLVNINIPNTVTSIGQYAFQGCSNLQISSLPTSLTTLNQYCFKGCTNATISSLPSTVTSLGTQTFQDCSNITLSSLPEGINYFSGSSTFAGCSKITIDKIPPLITTIMNVAGTFNGCTSITKMDFANATALGNLMFNNCTAMKSFIGEKVTTIPNANNKNSAFYNCTSLKAVWLGNAITSSGFARYAFRNCLALEKIYIDLPRATVESFANYQYKWSYDSLPNCEVICNDDNDFISATTFRNTEW